MAIDSGGAVPRILNLLWWELSCLRRPSQWTPPNLPSWQPQVGQGIARDTPQTIRPQGDGVFLPRTSFVGVVWAQDIHREWFEVRAPRGRVA